MGIDDKVDKKKMVFKWNSLLFILAELFISNFNTFNIIILQLGEENSIHTYSVFS
jgi:hypothetical protein